MAKQSRPLIAVPSRFSASASALRYRASVAARGLLSAVYAAGGEPLQVLPSAPGGVITHADAAARIGWADGLLLPGGGDISGRWSGQGDHPTLYDVDEEQDAFDLALARVALAKGIPVLAICRGLQIVNVARGGTLTQDMDSTEGLAHHRNHRHDISIEENSLLHSIVGAEVRASCYHHQCLSALGDGLVAVARSEEGVIEAAELPENAGWFVGVQWHPEDTWADDPVQLRVFAAFVAACGQPSS